MAAIGTSGFVVDLQIACEAPGLPTAADIGLCIDEAAAEAGVSSGGEVSVRIVGENEMQSLNRTYREKDQSTNVLAFPAELNDLPGLPRDNAGFIGDLLICAPVVAREASEQGKQAAAHWSHMLVHGMLHLLGFDHRTDDEARQMEALEIAALARRGVENPYKIKRLN